MRYRLILVRNFEGSIWILLGGTLWILPISFKIWPIKSLVTDSIGTNDPCSQIQLQCHRNWSNKRCWSVIQFTWLAIWWLLSNSRTISSFWEKTILTWYFSKKSQPNEWIRAEELGRKGISQRTQTKRDRFRGRSLMKLLDTHSMYHFSTLRQGLLYCSEVDHPECSSDVSKDTERFIPNLESGSLYRWRGRIGESPCSFLGSHHWELGGHWTG